MVVAEGSPEAPDACPFCGKALEKIEEKGVGGHVENVALKCACGYYMSPYDGLVLQPYTMRTANNGIGRR